MADDQGARSAGAMLSGDIAPEDVFSAAPGTQSCPDRFASASDEGASEQAILPLEIGSSRICDCPDNHSNCMSAGEWMKCQIGVWQFNYEGRDIRKKTLHPATFPIALPRRLIELFTHRGELVLDPFVGSGTTLVAARDLERNAVGFDLQESYVQLARSRLVDLTPPGATEQVAIVADARLASRYLAPESVSLIATSPPYANLLNRKRLNKSRRSNDRRNDQYLQIEQYSQDPRDLGTLDLGEYKGQMAEIFSSLLPLLKPRGHCVVNVPDMWWQDERITIHIAVVEALQSVGYELRNIIIWDRTNIVNKVGIFGWPNNYITMGITYEYLLDFWRPAPKPRRPPSSSSKALKHDQGEATNG